MIHEIDETLRRMLSAELTKIPGCPVRDITQITFDPPTIVESAQNTEARVNLYLSDVRENLTLRDQSFHITRRPGEMASIRRAPVRLDLSYVITTHIGGEPAAEHRLLSDVLGVLLRCQSVPKEYISEALTAESESSLILQVAQADHPAHADPASLWQALGGRIRPAIGLVAVAPFNPYESRFTRVVREAVIGLGIGTPPNGPRRPINVREIRVSTAGVVVDQADEKPLEGVEVTVDGRDETARSDAKGFFYLLNLPPGQKRLRFRKQGYAPFELEVTAPPPGRPDLLEPAVIALQSLDDTALAEESAARMATQSNAPELVEAGRTYQVSLTGRLRMANGRPAAYIPVRVGRQRTVTDGDGIYCFVNVPSGDHTVIAELPGYGEVQVPIPANTKVGALTLPAIGPAAADDAQTPPAESKGASGRRGEKSSR